MLQLLKSFLYIGSVSFGGYMSMVVTIRKKFVEEDKLISEEVFSQGLALASILPGPVAVNVAAYCGYLVAGLLGAAAAVIAVLLPSFIMMVSSFYLLQWVKMLFNFDLPIFLVAGVAFGLILSAAIQGIKKYCVSSLKWGVLVFSVLILSFYQGYWIILLLLVTWSVVGQFLSSEESVFVSKSSVGLTRGPRKLLFAVVLLSIPVIIGSQFLVTDIFTQFSRIGLTLFGGGYVVVPLLNSVLVQDLNWITQDDLLMGISLGQLTPGPLLISASYFGQRVAGIPGAFAAVAGMFFPTALLMIISSHFMARIRSSLVFGRALILILPFVAALIFFAALSIFRSSWTVQDHKWLFLWWAAAFVCIHFFNVKPVLLIGLAIAAGLLTLAF